MSWAASTWPAAAHDLLSELRRFPGRLALVPADGLSREVIYRLAAAAGAEVTSVGDLLTRSPTAPRPADVPALLDDAAFLVDLDILAWPDLALNPVQLLKLLARSKPRVAVWPGTVSDRRLRYSAPGRSDYIDEIVADVVVLRPRATSFPDEVPYTVERIPA